MFTTTLQRGKVGSDREDVVMGRSLSMQEVACLRLLLAGKSGSEIAADLGLEADAATSYLDTVFRKLGTKSRTHAVAIAIREGIISNDDKLG